MILSLVLVAAHTEAKRLKQTLPTPKVEKETKNKILSISKIEAQNDSLGYLQGVILSRYDKPADAAREALFLTNKTPTEIRKVTLEISYLVGGQEIHKRNVDVECQISQGETRKLEFASWDSQKSYCYRGSRIPKRRQTTLYDVRITPIAIEVNTLTD